MTHMPNMLKYSYFPYLNYNFRYIMYANTTKYTYALAIISSQPAIIMQKSQ